MIFNKNDKYYEKNIQNHRVALGNVTSDGTLANLTALLVAREKAFPPEGDFPGLRAAGVDRAMRPYGYSRGVVLVSKRAHYSITKAANLLGIGEENVISIPVDSGNRMDVEKLRRRVRSLQSDKAPGKTKIISIIGVAGTTETGVPRVDTRKAETTLIIKNHQTVVLGGLRENRTVTGVTKVPLLGDLPGVKYIFRSVSSSKVDTELLIFITVHIVESPELLPEDELKANELANLPRKPNAAIELIR